MNLVKILAAMQAKTREIYDQKYTQEDERGAMSVQVLTDESVNRWESAMESFGKLHVPYFSLDCTVHEKIAYSRRTGKNSGAEKEDLVGQESHWEGAVVSDDGKCICAFSGYDGADDVLIALAGIAEYEAQK